MAIGDEEPTDQRLGVCTRPDTNRQQLQTMRSVISETGVVGRDVGADAAAGHNASVTTTSERRVMDDASTTHEQPAAAAVRDPTDTDTAYARVVTRGDFVSDWVGDQQRLVAGGEQHPAVDVAAIVDVQPRPNPLPSTPPIDTVVTAAQSHGVVAEFNRDEPPLTAGRGNTEISYDNDSIGPPPSDRQPSARRTQQVVRVTIARPTENEDTSDRKQRNGDFTEIISR